MTLCMKIFPAAWSVSELFVVQSTSASTVIDPPVAIVTGPELKAVSSWETLMSTALADVEAITPPEEVQPVPTLAPPFSTRTMSPEPMPM